jgi:hypothetical protein
MRSMFDEELMELKKDDDGDAASPTSTSRPPARPRSRAESLFFQVWRICSFVVSCFGLSLMQLGLPGMLVAIMAFGFYVFVVRLCIQRLIQGGGACALPLLIM